MAYHEITNEDIKEVEVIANRILKSVGASQADYDDLVSDGMIGLMKAAESYKKPKVTVSFNAWAQIIIRREITNGLRKRWGRDFQKRYKTAPLDDKVEDHKEDVEKLVELRDELSNRIFKSSDEIKLTKRELQFLIAGSRGLSASSTAMIIGTSIETVKTQRASAIHKLNAKNITNAVAIAIRSGIME